MQRDKDQLREEYPEELIKSGVRGKHAKRFREGTNIERLEKEFLRLRTTWNSFWP
jgi:hypothetical protein